jgi:hypothetical protein
MNFLNNQKWVLMICIHSYLEKAKKKKRGLWDTMRIEVWDEPCDQINESSSKLFFLLLSVFMLLFRDLTRPTVTQCIFLDQDNRDGWTKTFSFFFFFSLELFFLFCLLLVWPAGHEVSIGNLARYSFHFTLPRPHKYYYFFFYIFHFRF